MPDASLLPIKFGRLTNALDANAQAISDIASLTLGSGTPTARVHILPAGTPTTAADGIKIGTDISLYRSAAGVMTIVGDVIVTGDITTDSPIALTDANNAWTGTASWSNTATFSGTVNVNAAFAMGSGGTVTLHAAAAAEWLDAIGAQAYHVNLANIAAISAPPTNNGMLYSNGTSFVLGTGSTLRDVIGLGTANSPTFTNLTLTGDASVDGSIELTTAATTGGGLTITNGGNSTHIYMPVGGVLTIDSDAEILGATKLDGASNITGILSLGATVDNANLYRSAANTLKTDGNLVVAGNLTITGGGSLSVTSGGTGLTSVAVDRILYTSSSNVFSATAITAFMRGALARTSAADFMSGIGASVLLANMAAGSVGTSQLVDLNVTTGKLADLGVTTAKLAADAVTTAKIANAQVTGAKVAANTIAEANIVANTLTSASLAVQSGVAATWGTAVKVPRITFNAAGIATAVSEVDIEIEIDGLLPAFGDIITHDASEFAEAFVGFTGTGSYTTFTIVNGIITAAA